MGFKLGTQGKEYSGTYVLDLVLRTVMLPCLEPVIRKSLAPGIMGEANNDGSIFISDEIQPGSALETEVLLHEMRHATDLKTGKLAYDDDYVKYNGVTYLRENRNGKDMIKVDGKWKEAGDDFPWENDANNKKNGDI